MRQLHKKSFHLYGNAFILSFSIILALILTINLIIDPLWYWKGNQITGINFAFNERLAKINLFYSRQKKIDCLIFGSSRTTLLNEKKISNYNCFNFAFSSGRIEEFIAFSHYITRNGFKPKLVILGIDGFNFTTHKPLNIPGFVLAKKSPPSLLESYLSSSVLEWSFQALNEKSKLPRFYKSDFTTGILPSAPRYHPHTNSTLPTKYKNTAHYNIDVIQHYKAFRNIFPDSRLIGYVPPLSAWEIAKIHKNGKLSSYVNILSKLSEIYTPLYDFSIPSKVTADATLTYDGSHYNEAVNLTIAETISNGITTFGIQTSNHTYTQLYQSYIKALIQYSSELNLLQKGNT